MKKLLLSAVCLGLMAGGACAEPSKWYGDTALENGVRNLILIRMNPLEKHGNYVYTWVYKTFYGEEGPNSGVIKYRLDCSSKRMKPIHIMLYSDAKLEISEDLDQQETGTDDIFYKIACTNIAGKVDNDRVFNINSTKELIGIGMEWMQLQKEKLAPDPTK